jgi:hypothetical protein
MPGPQDALQSDRQLGKLRTLLLPQAWKPLFVLNGYFFFQQFSGIYVVVYYAVDIILQAGVSMDEYVGTVLLGVVQLVAGIGVSFALTRQVLTNLSVIGRSVSGVQVCVYRSRDDRLTQHNTTTWALTEPHSTESQPPNEGSLMMNN